MTVKRVDVFLVNAFTKNGQGGNPAGVVLDADDLSAEQKQNIAKQVNLSETAFISKRRHLNDASEADFIVSFYTPTQEVDFCGHATLAAFFCLFEQDVIACGSYIQSTNVGELFVDISENGLVTIGQAPVQYFQYFEWAEIEKLINPPAHCQWQKQLPIQVVFTGLKDCIIPLSKGVLDNLTFDLPLISHFCKRHDLIGFHLFELEESADNHWHTPVRAQCRNIAPLVGIDEESATGSSSGALACYLNRYLDHKPTEFEFEQGRKMGALSSLSVKLTKLQNLPDQIMDQESVILNDEVNYLINLSGYSRLMGQEVINY